MSGTTHIIGKTDRQEKAASLSHNGLKSLGKKAPKTYLQWIREVRQVGHQDAYQRTHHNQHGAHPQDHHWQISYQLCIAGNMKETHLINSAK